MLELPSHVDDFPVLGLGVNIHGDFQANVVVQQHQTPIDLALRVFKGLALFMNQQPREGVSDCSQLGFYNLRVR